MPDNVVLGIHSSVNPGTEGSFNQFIDGHAWISVTRNGVTTNYGLWPDDHPMIQAMGQNDPKKSDIRTGMEDGQTATASRYYQLNEQQAAQLEQALRQNVTWGYTNTCASWATDTVSRITGQRIDGSEFGFTDTPRQTIRAIEALEQQRDTTPTNPLRPDEIRRSSSFGALEQPATDTQYAMQGTNRQQDWLQIHQAAGQGGLAGTERDNVAAAAYREFGQQLKQLDNVGIYNNSDRLVGTEQMAGGLTHNASVSIAQTRETPAYDTLQSMNEQQLRLSASGAQQNETLTQDPQRRAAQMV